MRIAMTMNSAIKKGTMPLNMVVTGTRVIPPKTRTTMPIGGLIAPTIIILTTITPNQIGSIPTALITGKRIGIVSNIIGNSGKKNPRIKNITAINATSTKVDTSSPAIVLLNQKGSLLTVIKLRNRNVPISIRKIIPDMLAVSLMLLIIPSKLICLLIVAMIIVPKAPIAPASVGVNIPP
jgi:hypothetical protein